MQNLIILFSFFFIFSYAQICDPSYPYYAIDGTCNNLENPLFGSAEYIYQRGKEGAFYGPNEQWRFSYQPDPREMSNAYARNDPSKLTQTGENMLFVFAAQFYAHDIGNEETLDYDNNYDFPLQFPILQTNDFGCEFWPFIGYNCNFSATPTNICLPNPEYGILPVAIEMKPAINETINSVPYILNGVNSVLDLSPLYSNSQEQSKYLRTGNGGKMLTSDYNTTSKCYSFVFPGQSNLGSLCDYTPYTPCFECLPSWNATKGQVDVPPTLNPDLTQIPIEIDKLWVAGDPRVGSNIAVSMITLMYLRNHNYLAETLATQNPTWADDQLYFEARRLNIAMHQHIFYSQVLPAIMGLDIFLIPPYTGYKPNVDPSALSPFDLSAFRAYGHTIVTDFAPISSCGDNTLFNQIVPNDFSILLAGQAGGFIYPEDVFNEIGSWENVIRGLIGYKRAAIDIEISDILRGITFGCVFPGITDLFSIDVIRGRESGTPPYYKLREVYSNLPDLYGMTGCPLFYKNNTEDDPIQCFNNLVPYNLSLAANLSFFYKKLIYIDSFVGMLIEQKQFLHYLPSTMAGILALQFTNMRDGDRFYYKNRNQPKPPTLSELLLIESTSFGGLLKQHFNMKFYEVPDNPFYVPPLYRQTLNFLCQI